MLIRGPPGEVVGAGLGALLAAAAVAAVSTEGWLKIGSHRIVRVLAVWRLSEPFNGNGIWNSKKKKHYQTCFDRLKQTSTQWRTRRHWSRFIKVSWGKNYRSGTAWVVSIRGWKKKMIDRQKNRHRVGAFNATIVILMKSLAISRWASIKRLVNSQVENLSSSAERLKISIRTTLELE